MSLNVDQDAMTMLFGFMSVLVTVGDSSLICRDRSALWSWCQLLASFMKNAGFY